MSPQRLSGRRAQLIATCRSQLPAMSSGKVVDQSLLDDFVVERRALWKNFSSHENVSKSHAADPQGLFDNYELLQGLLRLSSSSVFLLTHLRTALLRALAREPELNQTGLNNMVWASSRFEHVSCMFYHYEEKDKTYPNPENQ